MLYKTDGNYRINFVNNDEKAVDLVQFVIEVGGQTVYIKDAGTFTSGTSVNHYFGDRGGEIAVVDRPKISCKVRLVRFADGTEWEAPEAAGS